MKKAISLIEIKFLFVLIIVVLFGISFLIEFIKKNMWIVYFGVLFIIIFMVIWYFQFQEEKKCKNCFFKKNNLINSDDRILKWKYMTTKGYPDKRRKNNIATHILIKTYKCNDCEHIFEVESIYKK